MRFPPASCPSMDGIFKKILPRAAEKNGGIRRSFHIAFVCALAGAAFSCRTTETGFAVKIKNESNHHPIFSIFVLPEEEIEIEAWHAEAGLEAQAGAGRLVEVSRNKWKYRAPATGLSFIEIGAAWKMRINVFIMISPAQLEGEYLNDYRIGAYPEKAANGHRAGSTPAGFIEVTEANQNIQLTPHFQLKQFLCKQKSGFPKYLVLRERLLLALEFILQKVNDAGYKVETLAVLSGYRTPFYNDGLENKTFSRHLYGDAADIFVDANHDGRMDDLDDDGDVDGSDVKILFDLIDRLSAQEDYKTFLGGLGLYQRTAMHNGFVHIDTRGVKVKW